MQLKMTATCNLPFQRTKGIVSLLTLLLETRTLEMQTTFHILKLANICQVNRFLT